MERAKKPDPARTQPNRKGTFYRSKRGWNGHTNGSTHSGRFGASILDALGSCQKILDDQVRRGRKSEAPRTPLGGLGDQAERMIRTMSDAVIEMSTMWFDYLGSLIRVDDRSQTSSATQEPEAHHGHSNGSAAPLVQLAPPSAGTADLALDSHARPESVRFQPLTSMGGDVLLPDVQRADGPQGTWYRIEVSADQARGRYYGLVFDESTGEPCGKLSIEVGGS